jgi:hypothetical protein
MVVVALLYNLMILSALEWLISSDSSPNFPSAVLLAIKRLPQQNPQRLIGEVRP